MIRRIKEDVYRFDRENGKLVERSFFPPRKSETVEVFLSGEEKAFYDDLTDYIEASFKAARKRLGETAKFQSFMLALFILQRRAASKSRIAMCKETFSVWKDLGLDPPFFKPAFPWSDQKGEFRNTTLARAKDVFTRDVSDRIVA